MSGRSLMNPGKMHERADELESFFHVYTYYILRYQDCRLSDHDLALVMAAIYDQRLDRPNGFTGGEGKDSLFRGKHITPTLLRTSYCRPLATLIENLRHFFSPLYPPDEMPQDSLEELNEFQRQDVLLQEEVARARFARAMELLKTSAHVIAEFDKAINNDAWEAKPVVDRLAPIALTEPTVKRHMESSDACTADYKRRRELGPPHESR